MEELLFLTVAGSAMRTRITTTPHVPRTASVSGTAQLKRMLAGSAMAMDSRVQTVQGSPMVPRLVTPVATALAVRPDGRPATAMAYQVVARSSITAEFAAVIQAAVQTATAS